MTVAARLLAVLLGAWLMAAPAVLEYGGAAATGDRIAGPIVVGTSLPAAFAVLRGLRRVELLVGAWLVLAPWPLGAPTVAAVNSVAAGALLASFSFSGRSTRRRFAGGWRAAVRPRSAEGGA